MQVHELTFVVDAPPDVVWALFWSHRSGVLTYGDVTIEILHPGDERGEGLIRHATFPVPRYLLSGGVGRSWEWLTRVRPPVSWRYDAIGKPLWSGARGETNLEDLGDSRTRIRFRETYHAFNPVLRALLERRVHRVISRNNDRLMREGIETGVRAIRDAAATG
ncbi:MAG: SRPBCC family protein [Actinomycetota bacterium]